LTPIKAVPYSIAPLVVNRAASQNYFNTPLDPVYPEPGRVCKINFAHAGQIICLHFTSQPSEILCRIRLNLLSAMDYLSVPFVFSVANPGFQHLRIATLNLFRISGFVLRISLQLWPLHQICETCAQGTCAQGIRD